MIPPPRTAPDRWRRCFTLAGCVLLLILGKRLGTPLAGYVATFFIAVSFLCSGWAIMQWVLGGNYNGLPYKRDRLRR